MNVDKRFLNDRAGPFCPSICLRAFFPFGVTSGAQRFRS